MKCQDCNKREAQVTLTQIVHNEKSALHLCKECAAKRGFHSPLGAGSFPLAELLKSFTKPPFAPEEDPGESITCAECGLTFREFIRQGRFGCGQCYSSFRHRLEPIMRKIHGASLHLGRTPEERQAASDASPPLPVKEEVRLENELAKAIETEDFERAVEIRDKLKAIKHRLSVDK